MTLAVFHDFPGLENGLTKFHDIPGRVVTPILLLKPQVSVTEGCQLWAWSTRYAVSQPGADAEW